MMPKLTAQQTYDIELENVRLWGQATNGHSDQTHKSGPLLGPFLIKRHSVSIYNSIDKLC
jgi:hypothetical protein